MKILIVSQYYFPEQFRITDICETLVKRGHVVTVLTAQPNYPEGKIYQSYTNKYHYEEINGVKVHRSKIHPRGKGSLNLFLNYVSFPFYANKHLKKLGKNYDVVFINQLSPITSAIPGLKYAKTNKTKTVMYCLDLWPESLISGGIKRSSLIYKIMDRISTKIYAKSDIIAITSKSFMNKFSNNLKNKIVYLPQYAEDIFSPLPVKEKQNGIYNFVFAGNIGEMQSVETIVYAANELKAYKNIVFNIYGSGSKLNALNDLCTNLSLENVVLHGKKPIEDMPKYYENADALLVTLKKDALISMTLPGKIQTYLATGKPIIGAIDGETKIIIEEANAGYICEAENYKELSKIILLATKSSDLIQMGKNGFAYYIENFSKEIFMNNLENIFTEEINVR